eukprot:scaffold96764_cov21-Tisochrysis_lutea.AAC.1
MCILRDERKKGRGEQRRERERERERGEIPRREPSDRPTGWGQDHVNKAPMMRRKGGGGRDHTCIP